MSFQVTDLCCASSQLVHWPCWDCCTPFISLLLSSSFLTSWMTMLWKSLPLACDHHFFSFTPKPCLPVWVRPITSLKARFSLALIIVSLTFYFLPVFNIGFKDFITLSLESSSIIWSLTLLDLNSSIIDFSGNFSFACPQYIATLDKPGGNPNHFRVYLFIFTSIFSTALIKISYTRRGYNIIWINTCWRHHTLYFPCRGQQSILYSPSCKVLDVSFTWLVSFIDSSYQCPRLFTGRSDTVRILWPPISKLTFWFNFPFLRERLLNFWGLNFILHQIIRSSIKLISFCVVHSLDDKIVMSSIKAFTGGIWQPRANSTKFDLLSVALRSSHIDKTKSTGETVHPIAIPTSSCKIFSGESHMESIEVSA